MKTRFAPSPTGFIHMGNVRSALFPWLFAKANNSELILRIEDTDTDRNNEEAVDVIVDGLRWLGIDHSPIVRQSNRVQLYKDKIQELIDNGYAYYCYTSEEELKQYKLDNPFGKYPDTWRPETNKLIPVIPENVTPVVRFKTNKTGVTTWVDNGNTITIDNSQLDDFVILRSDGMPTYNLCVVVDDADMGITHVIRGNDHINNTPKQIQLYNSFGYSLPTFVHLPTVLDNNGKKLSKREGAPSLMQYKYEGYLPEAIINYLALLGWSSNDNTELFTVEKLINEFSLDRLHTNPARFDIEKLTSINKHHISEKSSEDLGKICDLSNIVLIDLIKSRCSTLLELKQLYSVYSLENTFSGTVDTTLVGLLDNSSWDAKSIMSTIKSFAKETNQKMPDVILPIRKKLYGSESSPSIGELLVCTDKNLVIEKLKS